MGTTDNPGASGSAPGASGTGEPQDDKTLADRIAALEQKNKELLAEKKAAQAKLLAAEAQAKAEADEKARLQEEKLKEKGDYQKLHEQEKQRAADALKAKEEADAKYAELNKRIVDSRKIGLVKAQLGGRIKDEYIGLIDPEQIPVDEATGEIDQAAAKKYAQEFAAKYPEVIMRANGTKMPNEAPGASGPIPTYEEWKSGINSKDPETRAKMKAMTSKVYEKHAKMQ